LVDVAKLGNERQLLHSSISLVGALRRPMRCVGMSKRCAVRRDDAAIAAALAALIPGEANFVEGSSEASFKPSTGQVGSVGEVPNEVDVGPQGSTMIALHALLPALVRHSAKNLGGSPVSVVLRGTTNSKDEPQVDYVQHVVAPLLARLVGVHLDLQVRRRGFQDNSGEVVAQVSAARWPLLAFDLLDQGRAATVMGFAFRSLGVPENVMPRFLEGQLKKKPAGASVALIEVLPNVPVEWKLTEEDTNNGNDGCGVVIVIETTSGCRVAGDSLGRKGTPAEKMGDEAVRVAYAALTAGTCADERLRDWLLVLMALAEGTSRLLIGKGKPTEHTAAGIRLVQRFGVAARVTEEDGVGFVLEVVGLCCPQDKPGGQPSNASESTEQQQLASSD